MPTPELEGTITTRRASRTRRTSELVKLAQERFYGCEACRFDESYDFIDHVVRPLKLRKRERQRLFRALTCRECESSVQSGTFVLGPDRSQLRRLALSKKFDRLHREEYEEFRDLLVRYPMLGAEHPFGRRLAKAVSRAKKTNLEPALWFRATTNTREPALGPRPRERAARACRFNQIGQVVWYLGKDARTAAVEVLREPRPGVPFAIGEVKILEPIPVLDLRLFWQDKPIGTWILREVIERRLLSEPTDALDESRPQYRVPQYVADLARRHGFRGILYDSTRPSAYNNPEAWGTNLVLFDPIPQHELALVEIMEFGEPTYDIFTDRWPLRQFAQNTISKEVRT